MIYIEYINRRADVDRAVFHQAVQSAQEGWDDGFAEDQLIWTAARTWRLGPTPEYLTVWYTPNAGFDRIDAWDDIFRRGHADIHENQFRRVAEIEAAGCYNPLLAPVPAKGGIYYVEYFRPGANSTATRVYFAERAQRHPELTLNLLVERIGRLAPDPGGVAVWTIPNFASLSRIADEITNVRVPIELVGAGTYVDVGQEIL